MAERHPAAGEPVAALTELREHITALDQHEPTDPMFGAHLTLALLKVGRRLDDLEDRLS